MAKRQKGDVVLRHLKQIKAGVDRPGYNAERRAELTEAIEKHLASPTLDSLLRAAINLDGLGLVEGVKGVAGIWQGEPEGWTYLQTSFAYLSWNVRICTGLFQRGRLKAGWSFTHLNLAARCLAHAMATGDDVFAEWCGRTLLTNFSSSMGLYDRSPRAFEPFMVHLFARWQSLPVPGFTIPCVPLGVYQELLDAWDDEQAFATALVKVCDYHVEHSIEERVAHAEFVSVPHNVFPAEILAVKRLRNAAGLPWPAVEHPLLNTPLAQLPTSIPQVRSDMLDRVASAAQAALPEVCPPNSPE